jgi:hypothetical protein
MAAFNVQGQVINKATKLPVPMANVKLYEVDKVAAGYKSDFLTEGLTGLDGKFNVTFAWPYDVSIPTNRPDIIFKVTQKIDGTDKVIYNENPATETRWNIGDILSVTLEAEDCISIMPTPTGRPYDTLFVFTRVGVIGVNNIHTVGAGASGYAYPDIDPAAPNSRDANSPFGSTLDIAGWFGQFTDTVRYKIQYSSDGVNFTDISDPLYNSYYEYDPSGGNWITIAMGPFTEGGKTNVYKMPYVEKPGQPWIFPDLIAKWDTTKVLDGLYTLRIQGFKWNALGTALEPSVALLIDPGYGTLKLRIDNSPPISKINGIKHNGSTVNVCDIVNFTSGTLSIEFEASDSKGHLREYVLNAMYGHNNVVSPLPPNATDNYSKHIDATRQWKGGVLDLPHPPSPLDPPNHYESVKYDATAYPSAKMPKCAYQFRLDVTKRTTNGYGLIWWGVEDTVHITLER